MSRKMKSILDFAKVVAMLVIILLSVGVVGAYETHYKKECKIYEVNGDLVTYEDNSGNLWDYEISDSNFKNQNQKYILVFDTNYTNSIYDDMIVKIKIKKEKGN